MAPTAVLPLTASDYAAHPVHRSERVWTETNCYVDLWIELLHSLGLDPVAAAACALSADFDGEQWVFLKFPLEDLRALYGIDVQELNVWRPVIDHVETHAAAGRLLTLEVDAFHLPDTAGVSYGLVHTKTTIVPNMIDREARRLGYFHNAGYFELEGDDFDGIFRLGAHADANALPPYAEVVRLGGVASDALAPAAAKLAHTHIDRAPKDNPVARLAEQVQRDVEWLTGKDIELFHLYSFGMLRQCGFTAELASDFCSWLTAQGFAELDGAAECFRTVAETAKSVQFKMARLARGRSVDVSEGLATMASQWGLAFDEVRAWHAG
jgi:hypothetical protein